MNTIPIVMWCQFCHQAFVDVAPNGARLRLCLLAQELQAERRKHQDHPYTRELAFPEQIPEKHKVQPYDDDHHKQDVQHSRHVLAHSFSKLVSERSAWSRYLRSQFPPGGEVPLCRGTTTPHHVCAVLSERADRDAALCVAPVRWGRPRCQRSRSLPEIHRCG